MKVVREVPDCSPSTFLPDTESASDFDHCKSHLSKLHTTHVFASCRLTPLSLHGPASFRAQVHKSTFQTANNELAVADATANSGAVYATQDAGTVMHVTAERQRLRQLSHPNVLYHCLI